MREQHVAFCCSGEHTLHFLAAAGRSLLDHHPQTSALRFHVVYEHWSPTTLERIETSWNPARISFYRLSDYLGTRALEPEYGYWFRTWLYLLLPKEIDQVL
ncbi:MAG: hypothetical protein KC800_22765, partial [Candidatus Eremiobacteraeota bacterium]|nr:hypothetical protein [Candidatus Eremiobacteraeota bacterium]